MENSSESPRKNEFVETMFKSLNSYTSELQQELEILNQKVADQTLIEQTYDKSQEQLQDDLIKLRAAIETNTVKRSLLDRNLSERTTMSQLLHGQIVEKRQEQNAIIDKANTVKYNHHRNIGKITEQCANLTMAFRTNYHAYARADLDEIRKKTEIRLKTISDEVANTELTVINHKDKLAELNEKLDREIIHFNYLKESIEIIGQKLQIDNEDIIDVNNLEKQLADLQLSINELEAWHMRTNYPS
ncbi:unnamed protein product [Rotaria socialis]|uniref:Uncharacterized protein n=1 Tax=Rotaria socialis TaxID=392032 RepID=A0A818C5J4_9BILA|nr:unnamed protein product [Rotaria socialis]CAF3423356.1 unnamed protein product [Rotaria socialis]